MKVQDPTPLPQRSWWERALDPEPTTVAGRLWYVVSYLPRAAIVLVLMAGALVVHPIIRLARWVRFGASP